VWAAAGLQLKLPVKTVLPFCPGHYD